MKRFWQNNSLSIILIGLFFAFLVGLALTGHAQANEELQQHGRAPESLSSYLGSGDFVEAVFENWESEFLQMGALVLLTIWFKQKGSADSKKLRGAEPTDTKPRYRLRGAKSWPARWRAIRYMLYSYSLTIALFGLFILSFVLHAAGGVVAANEAAQWHGGEIMTMGQYMLSSQFWFESFQNWQSEFIAVASLLLLSIFLRQRYSPQSKPVEDANSTTGE